MQERRGVGASSGCDAGSAVTRISHNNDFGVFASVKSRVWREEFGTVEEMTGGVQRLFGEYDDGTLDDRR